MKAFFIFVILYIFIIFVVTIITLIPIRAAAEYYGLPQGTSGSQNETSSGITQEQTINSINLPTSLPSPTTFLNLLKQKITLFLTSEKATDVRQEISKRIGEELGKDKQQIEQRLKEEAKKQLKKKEDEAKEELQKRIKEETPKAKNWFSQTLENFKNWLYNKIKPVPKY